MTPRHAAVFALAALFIAALMISTGNAQQISEPVKAVHLLGLEDVKQDTKGTLVVEGGRLHFGYTKASADVKATSIEDVVTGADSQVAVGNTVHMISMAAPYGGGRFLSLFRKRIDTLTVEYRDGDGGLHGAIFTMPVGAADVIKKQLVAQGAHTTATREPNGAPAAASPSPSEVQKR
jgi:hypothetical protein